MKSNIGDIVICAMCLAIAAWAIGEGFGRLAKWVMT